MKKFIAISLLFVMLITLTTGCTVDSVEDYFDFIDEHFGVDDEDFYEVIDDLYK